MPYISEKERIAVERSGPANAGQLNFKITTIVRDYLLEHGESYQTFNDVIGVLEGAKLELYRRVVASYENEKCKENGDVY